MKKNKRPLTKRVFLATVMLTTLTATAPGLGVHAEKDSTPVSEKKQMIFDNKGESSQGSNHAITTQSVEAFADEYFSQPDVQKQLNGAVFVVVKDGKVIMSKGYGYEDMVSKKPVDPETTVFHMASISKLFTTTAVMQLAERGKIDLDQDISKYMEGVTIENETGTPITMKNLMTHTTGYNFPDVFGTTEGVSLDSFVKEYVPTVVSKPGSAYRYDNLAFQHQGYIVEKVSKQPFETYVDDNIFKPLGMTSTGFVMNSEISSRLATGHHFTGDALPEYISYPEVDPTKGMYSTGSDMANYMIAMLNGGKIGDTNFLKEETVRDMEAPQYSINPDMPVMSYGFESVYTQLHNGQTVIGKGGDIPGYHSWMWLLPEQNVGAIVIVNGEAIDPRMELFSGFMQKFFPDERPAGTPMRLTREQLSKFEGTYGGLRLSMLNSKVTAGMDGTLNLADQAGVHKLTQLEPLLFQDEQGTLVGFKEGDNGQISHYYYSLQDTFMQKLSEPQQYSDVSAGSPYSSAIHLLKQLEVISTDSSNTFRPEEAMTRAEYVQMLLKGSGIKPLNHPVTFKDTAGHPLAKEIQTVAEILGVQGVGDGRFEPDREITRQEAASILWKYVQLSMPTPAAEVKIAGTQPASWAKDAVSFVIAVNLFGPEVKVTADGTINYEPNRPMLRQEAANLFAKMFQPAQI
ncbi:serine hydrolase [Paenibacillus sp. NPDC056933]|uniref:serine hydrolase n=1 Tax=Paenibacillus sp. NPDC056933 TaxID=3345968 RepID=UPI00363E3FBE